MVLIQSDLARKLQIGMTNGSLLPDQSNKLFKNSTSDTSHWFNSQTLPLITSKTSILKPKERKKPKKKLKMNSKMLKS